MITTEVTKVETGRQVVIMGGSWTRLPESCKVLGYLLEKLHVTSFVLIFFTIFCGRNGLKTGLREVKAKNKLSNATLALELRLKYLGWQPILRQIFLIEAANSGLLPTLFIDQTLPPQPPVLIINVFLAEEMFPRSHTGDHTRAYVSQKELSVFSGLLFWK